MSRLFLLRTAMAKRFRLLPPAVLVAVCLGGPLPAVRAAFTTTGSVNPAGSSHMDEFHGWLGIAGTLTVDNRHAICFRAPGASATRAAAIRAQ